MPKRLTITLAKGATFVTVVAAGELDRDDASRLDRYVNAVAFTFDGRIELDLRGVEHIDAQGVRTLMNVRRRLGSRLRIVPSESVVRAVHFVARSERNRLEGGEDERQLTGPAR